MQTINENHLTKEALVFTGRGLSLLGYYILLPFCLIGGVFTLGYTIAWWFKTIIKWREDNTTINGKQQRFDGKTHQLWVSIFFGLVLCFLTFGIYFFWLRVRINEWRAEHTFFVGEEPVIREYTDDENFIQKNRKRRKVTIILGIIFLYFILFAIANVALTILLSGHPFLGASVTGPGPVSSGSPVFSYWLAFLVVPAIISLVLAISYLGSKKKEKLMDSEIGGGRTFFAVLSIFASVLVILFSIFRVIIEALAEFLASSNQFIDTMWTETNLEAGSTVSYIIGGVLSILLLIVLLGGVIHIIKSAKSFPEDPEPMTRSNNSSFEGTAFQSFKLYLLLLLSSIGAIFTLGYTMAIYFKKDANWRLSNTVVCDYQYNFDAKSTTRWVISIINSLLTVITLGIYAPWATKKVIKWEIEHIALDTTSRTIVIEEAVLESTTNNNTEVIVVKEVVVEEKPNVYETKIVKEEVVVVKEEQKPTTKTTTRKKSLGKVVTKRELLAEQDKKTTKKKVGPKEEKTEQRKPDSKPVMKKVVVKEAPKKSTTKKATTSAKSVAPVPATKETPKVYHVSQHSDGGWQVKAAKAQKAIKKHPTQKEAIDHAKQLANSQGGSIRIHSRVGKIRSE